MEEFLSKNIFHSNLSVSTWYAISFAVFFGFWIIIQMTRRVIRVAWLTLSFIFLKRLLYPSLFHRTHFFGLPTRFDAFLSLLYISINVVCMTVRVHSATDFGDRAATMSTINLLPLLCGPRLLLVTQILGISIGTHLKSHRLFGTMLFLQAALHTTLSIVDNIHSWNWTKINISGVMVTWFPSNISCIISLISAGNKYGRTFVNYLITIYTENHVRMVPPTSFPPYGLYSYCLMGTPHPKETSSASFFKDWYMLLDRINYHSCNAVCFQKF